MHSYSGVANASSWGHKPSGILAKQCLDHHHGDCYVQGHSHPEIYRRPKFDPTPQMGDWAPSSFESNRFTVGDEPAQQQQEWSTELGEVPKDCYFCKYTGKCAQDTPEYGSGKDYMGNDCNACSGTGTCPHCGGDAIIG